MKKILLSLAAGLILFAISVETADAQRGRWGGGGFSGYRGGGVAFRGGGFRAGGVAFRGGGFYRGAGFYRGGFIRGGGVYRAGFVGRGFYGRRWAGGYYPYRPYGFYRRAAFIGAGAVGYGYGYGYGYGGYGGCSQWRVVPTAYGPQYVRVNVCYAPVVYGGYPYGYRAGYVY